MTIELKNMYEDLIKEMIIDGINGMTPELREAILSAPIAQQRAMVLTVMEENNPEHRLLCSKIRKVVNANKTGESKHIADVVKMVREYVEVSDTEVKTMGEVMTPISLVEEMLDTLPYEVWTNPELKWLDPCNGVGTFMSVVVKRLMKGLESFEPVASKRYAHIMENMVHTCELQSKNVFLYLYAFDPKDEFALNVYNGSYLDEGFDRHMDFWGVEKFDVIVMNPPYQVQKEGNTKTQPLWDKFVIKTIDQLVEGGHLVAIHPSGWRNPNGMFKNIQMLLREKQLSYLEIHDQKDGIKTFGAEIRYDFYCLHNVPNTMFTKIKCQDGTIERADLSKMEFIPNGMFNEIQKLLPTNGEEVIKMLRDCPYHTQKDHMNKEQTEEFKYPCVNFMPKTDIPVVYHSNTNQKGHFGTPKLIMSNGRIKSVGCMLDENGEYGLTQFAFGIVDEITNLPRIKQAIDSDGFRNLMNQCAINDSYFNKKIIALFRKDFWKEFLY